MIYRYTVHPVGATPPLPRSPRCFWPSALVAMLQVPGKNHWQSAVNCDTGWPMSFWHQQKEIIRIKVSNDVKPAKSVGKIDVNNVMSYIIESSWLHPTSLLFLLPSAPLAGTTSQWNQLHHAWGNGVVGLASAQGTRPDSLVPPSSQEAPTNPPMVRAPPNNQQKKTRRIIFTVIHGYNKYGYKFTHVS